MQSSRICDPDQRNSVRFNYQVDFIRNDEEDIKQETVIEKRES